MRKGSYQIAHCDGARTPACSRSGAREVELQNRDSPESFTEVVIACGVMKPELEFVALGRSVRLEFLDQGLHRTPNKMAALIQERIDSLPESVRRVILAYGLCSNGILGVKATDRELLVPRCHDCIALFLGSLAAYRAAFESRPGTYYLSPGWVAAKKDPLGIIYDDYAARVDLQTAFWVMEEELKHYTHIALINNGVGDIDSLRARARENCQRLKKEYLEIRGSLDYFVKLIEGPYDRDEFLVVPPGQQLVQEMFF